jgi:prepilin-type N-terminal cleavage/methylation domain-containing protein
MKRFQSIYKKIVHTKSFKKGFTLLELMIVVAIMAIMTAIVLFDGRGLNSSLLLSNTAYEMGLLVREAQTYGLGSRGTGDVAADFNYQQGIHVEQALPNQVVLFADKNNDNHYNGSGSGEEIQVYSINIDRAGQILKICVPVAATPSDTTCTAVASADILFKRPNPEAVFGGAIPAGSGSVVINIGFLNSPGCRSITVQKAGSIQTDSFYCN